MLCRGHVPGGVDERVIERCTILEQLHQLLAHGSPQGPLPQLLEVDVFEKFVPDEVIRVVRTQAMRRESLGEPQNKVFQIGIVRLQRRQDLVRRQEACQVTSFYIALHLLVGTGMAVVRPVQRHQTVSQHVKVRASADAQFRRWREGQENPQHFRRPSLASVGQVPGVDFSDARRDCACARTRSLHCGSAEVGQLDVAVGLDEDVRHTDVQVGDPTAVQEAECVRHLGCDKYNHVVHLAARLFALRLRNTLLPITPDLVETSCHQIHTVPELSLVLVAHCTVLRHAHHEGTQALQAAEHEHLLPDTFHVRPDFSERDLGIILVRLLIRGARQTVYAAGEATEAASFTATKSCEVWCRTAYVRPYLPEPSSPNNSKSHGISLQQGPSSSTDTSSAVVQRCRKVSTRAVKSRR